MKIVSAVVDVVPGTANNDCDDTKLLASYFFAIWMITVLNIDMGYDLSIWLLFLYNLLIVYVQKNLYIVIILI